MKKVNPYIDIKDINSTLDDLVSNINVEFDSNILQDKLDDVVIKRLVTERVTISRIKNILNQMTITED